MKILAIGDTFIPEEMMKKGLQEVAEAGHSVTVRQWKHENLEALQKDNLLVEQSGPDAVRLPEELFADIGEYEAVIVQFAPVSRQTLEQAGKLKLVGVLRGGVENIAVDFAAGRGVAVVNTPGRNARAVAEFTVGLLLAEIRNIARAHAALKKSVWQKDFPNSGAIPELYGKTAGLIGLGHVGRLVAGYLRAFGCRIVAYDPYAKAVDGIELLELPAVLKAADIVSVHARYTADTHHLIGAKEIALMRPGAVLINTARSGLVDQAALVRALQEKRIRGAGLDVFDVEPVPAEDELLQLDNLTLAPHLAGSTADAFANSPKLFGERLLKALKGEGVLSIVNGVKLG